MLITCVILKLRLKLTRSKVFFLDKKNIQFSDGEIERRILLIYYYKICFYDTCYNKNTVEITKASMA